MPRLSIPVLFCLSVGLGLVNGVSAQAPTVPNGAASAPATAPSPSAPAALPAPGEPRPYDKLITAEAKTQNGLFRLHQIKDRYYFEIPKALLDEPLLMVATATAVPEGAEHVGRTINEDVLRFTLKGHRLLVQTVSNTLISDPALPNAAAVRGSQRDAILAVLPVEAYSKDGAPVVEVSRLFTTELGDFSARPMLRAAGLDPSRSYVDQAKAFAASLRIDAVQTYGLMGLPTPPLQAGALPPAPQPVRSASINVAYNLVRLPETPMRPRLFDDRVGFFWVDRVDFGGAEHESRRLRYITRWRLEKQDPAAVLSEPVKPLVWYIDSATPTALVPYIKRGVEAWNSAFEAAGFKNAIQAKPFPTPEEDPEFDPQDVRYSVIRWVPSTIPNAYGPHLADPRSGEILNANVVLFHDVMRLLRDWYVIQAGPLDARVRQLPLPDELMGELVASVVSHELGHALGFPHNMKASSLYPVEKLRDPEWLRSMGHTPSLMDYSRFNYLVQPEDHIDPTLLLPRVGPYDRFATRWGYAPIPDAASAQEELSTLRGWLREQDEKPWLRFSSPRAEGGDFGDNAEAVGDADAVRATTLGLKNLERVIAMLPRLNGHQGREDRVLEALYLGTWVQWAQELGHVLAIVGGYDMQNKHNDQAGSTYTALPRQRQQQALRFFAEQAFKAPDWLLSREILERLPTSRSAVLQLGFQRLLLRQLFDRARLMRLQQQETLLGAKAYRLDELLQDLRPVLWAEPSSGQPVAAARRNLQRAYLELLGERIHGPMSAVDDGRALMRAELKYLQGWLQARASNSTDRGQRAHFAMLADYAGKQLDPRPEAPLGAPAAAARPNWRTELSNELSTGRGDSCWEDRLLPLELVQP